MVFKRETMPKKVSCRDCSLKSIQKVEWPKMWWKSDSMSASVWDPGAFFSYQKPCSSLTACPLTSLTTWNNLSSRWMPFFKPWPQQNFSSPGISLLTAPSKFPYNSSGNSGWLKGNTRSPKLAVWKVELPKKSAHGLSVHWSRFKTV